MTDIMFLYTKGFEIETDIKTGPMPTRFQSLDGRYVINSLSTATENHIVLDLNNKIDYTGVIYSRLAYRHIATEDNGIKKLCIPEQIFNVIADVSSNSLDRLLENIPVTAFIALYDHRYGASIDEESDFPPSPFPYKIKEKHSLMDLLLDWSDCFNSNEWPDVGECQLHWYPKTTKDYYCDIMNKLFYTKGRYNTDIVKEPYFIIGETAVIHYATRMMGLLYRIPDFALNIINNNRILGSKYKEVFTEYNQKHDEFVRSIASFKEQHGQLMKKVI